MAAVTFTGISKSFGAGPVLTDVDLTIADGEFMSLLGPSGCGKTTLLRILAGLETQDEGDVHIGDVEVSDFAPKQRDIAMVFQSYALYPYMTVAENIALPLTMRRLSSIERMPLFSAVLPSARRTRVDIAAEVQAVADGLGIGALLDRRPGQLSGGQRQRVALARAMVRRPAAFLMDEPLSNLDAKMRVKARTEIADLHRRLGATFIYVTHDQTEAMTMSDRVAVMLGGRVLQVDTPQRLYAEPAHLDVACFVGTPEINVLPAARRSDGVIEVGDRAWPVSILGIGPEATRVAVRPEAWTVGAKVGAGTIVGTLRLLEHLGSDTFLHVEVDGLPSRIVARVDPVTGASLTMDAPLTLAVAPERVLAFGADGRRIAVTSRGDERPMLREVVHG